MMMIMTMMLTDDCVICPAQPVICTAHIDYLSSMHQRLNIAIKYCYYKFQYEL